MEKRVEKATSTPSSTHRAYLSLRHAIITGKVNPGDRLKVDDLKVELQTGASPVREALSLLTSDQLVERIDQRGFRVARASRAQFEEVLELRCTLETLALGQSFLAGNQKWEESLVLEHHRMNLAIKNPDRFEYHHKCFHQTLLSACGSPILMRFCEQLYDLNVRYRNLAGRSKSYDSRDVKAEHAAILDAAVERDVEKGSALLVEHYRRTGAFLAEQFE